MAPSNKLVINTRSCFNLNYGVKTKKRCKLQCLFVKKAKAQCRNLFFVYLIVLTYKKGSHREVYRDFQPSLTSSVGIVLRVV